MLYAYKPHPRATCFTFIFNMTVEPTVESMALYEIPYIYIYYTHLALYLCINQTICQYIYIYLCGFEMHMILHKIRVLYEC